MIQSGCCFTEGLVAMLQANTGVHEASDLLQTFFFFTKASVLGCLEASQQYLVL